ncbi:ABC transporter ATP-binding protein [Streptomyces virginiae]|uniref:ABC transporter ATP-binding protein n=1 Tax=Streptomyces virginiae TaxID=1961 RepID=UPI002255C1E5|nr:ABC transporter ATP-binding protein [Streptomyces virginiae]MCX4962116.1 ABC transporter ATP-binding protein [Streptomyces virginiae]
MTTTTDTTSTTTKTTVLEAKGVTMRFGGLTAVKGVDLQVNAGEIVGLIGPNGAGKTTFFNCLTGLYVPTEGSVSYKGTVLPPKPHKVTEAGIARTFQNIRLFHNMTVLENVLVGRHTRTKEGLWSALLRGPGFKKAEAASEARAMELLEFIGLENKAQHLAKNLPYGEQRKLEIARALASDPGLILLDEPTAGMNPQETRAAEELIFAIRDMGIAVLVIEHDMRFIFNLCDRVACLVQGEKLIEGTAAEVQGDERVIAAYLGEPFEGDPGAADDAAVEAAEAAAAEAAAPAEPEAETEVEAAADAEVEVEAEAAADAEATAEATETDAEPEAEAAADTDGDTDAPADADSDSTTSTTSTEGEAK